MKNQIFKKIQPPAMKSYDLTYSAEGKVKIIPKKPTTKQNNKPQTTKKKEVDDAFFDIKLIQDL